MATYSAVYTEAEVVGRQREPLDHTLVTYFAAPKSFTGEDVIEVALHGGLYLQSAFLRALEGQGVRLARPGEFSHRAYLNGQMDLSQAEAVADLISSETEAQARVARVQLEGRLSDAISKLGAPLRELLAEIEAYIDFPEEDIEPLALEKWCSALSPIRESMERYLGSYSYGRLCREGAEVALVGVPNAGKSSLLNCLLGEERAIVTAVAGTTRDSIGEKISLQGLSVHLWDTAGIVDRAGDLSEQERIEQIGVERSRKHLRESDAVVFLLDLEQDLEQQGALLAEAKELCSRLILAISKCDTIEADKLQAAKTELSGVYPGRILEISSKSDRGTAELRQELFSLLAADQQPKASVMLCNQRHFLSLSEAKQAVSDAIELLQGQATQAELVAFEIRSALTSLNEIVGVTANEDILDLIFSKFCIGK
jgi:tRNA modification GTPase